MKSVKARVLIVLTGSAMIALSAYGLARFPAAASVQAAAASSTLANSVSSDPELRHRATVLLTAWENGDPEGIWGTLSTGIRESIEKQKYVSSLKLFFKSTKLVDFEILSIDQRDSQATVHVELKISGDFASGDSKFKKIPMASQWTRQADKVWYFDGHLPMANTRQQ